MSERFFVDSIGSDEIVTLTGDEAHHLARVSRVAAGQRVRIFDGSGIECEATVQSVSKRAVQLIVVRREQIDRELGFELNLACVPPKGERFRWMVEKATELGATRLIPLASDRAGEHVRGFDTEKTRRWVIEASKQCGRNMLMQVVDVVPWAQFVHFDKGDSVRLVAHPGAPPLISLLSRGVRRVTVAIGPEGGFADDEIEEARRAGWQMFGFGLRILRVETAAVAALAQVAAIAEINGARSQPE